MQRLTYLVGALLVLAIGCQPEPTDAGPKGDAGPLDDGSCWPPFTECSAEALSGESSPMSSPFDVPERVEGTFGGVLHGAEIVIETPERTYYLRPSIDPTPLASIVAEGEPVIIEADPRRERVRILRASDRSLLALSLRVDLITSEDFQHLEDGDASDVLDLGAASVEIRPGCGYVRDLGFDCTTVLMEALDVAFLDADGAATVIPLGATEEVSTPEGRFLVHNLWSTRVVSAVEPSAYPHCQNICGIAIRPEYAVDIVRVE